MQFWHINKWSVRPTWRGRGGYYIYILWILQTLKTSEESLSWEFLLISKHVLSYIIIFYGVTDQPSGMRFWDSPEPAQLQ